jgi:hypothetical protein
MAFSGFGNPSGGAGIGGAAASIQNGPELEDIQTEVHLPSNLEADHLDQH